MFALHFIFFTAFCLSEHDFVLLHSSLFFHLLPFFKKSCDAWRWLLGRVENTPAALWTQAAGGEIGGKCDVNSFSRQRRFAAFKSCRDWIWKGSANRLLLSATRVDGRVCVCPEATW